MHSMQTHTHASVFICALANADTLRYSSAPTHAHAHTHTRNQTCSSEGSQSCSTKHEDTLLNAE